MTLRLNDEGLNLTYQLSGRAQGANAIRSFAVCNIRRLTTKSENVHQEEYGSENQDLLHCVSVRQGKDAILRGPNPNFWARLTLTLHPVNPDFTGD
jgi:hypothetical protein